MKVPAFSRLVLVSALSLLAVGARAGTILGTADTYAVMGQTLVSNPTTFGNSVITGDVGVSPSGTCTGFIPVACGGAANGTISGAIHIDDPVSAQALFDAEAAEGALLGTVSPVPIALSADLGTYGSLAPGIYTFTSSATLTGTLTLAAGANLTPLWIFETGTTLTTAIDNAQVLVTDTTGGLGVAAAGVY